MGRASRAKKTRRGRPQDNAALEQLLREQYEFLKVSAVSFDAGFEAEAKRLAVVLRVLLHDTTNSASLLGQLGAKDRIRYVDTAAQVDPRNLMSTTGLTQMKVTAGEAAVWVATLDDDLSSPHHQPDASFSTWWTDIVLKDSDGEQWCRKDMVLVLANQDGGAHVDPALDERYVRLARENTSGWLSMTADGLQPMANSPVSASVRQIAHEVIRTLEKYLGAELQAAGASPPVGAYRKAVVGEVRYMADMAFFQGEIGSRDADRDDPHPDRHI